MIVAEPTPIRDPAQLGLNLRPGKREHAQPKLAWKRWSAEERAAIEMNDCAGSYSTGRMVEEHN